MLGYCVHNEVFTHTVSTQYKNSSLISNGKTQMDKQDFGQYFLNTINNYQILLMLIKMEQDTMTSKFQKVNNAYLHYEVIQGRAELWLGKRNCSNA